MIVTVFLGIIWGPHSVGILPEALYYNSRKNDRHTKRAAEVPRSNSFGEKRRTLFQGGFNCFPSRPYFGRKKAFKESVSAISAAPQGSLHLGDEGGCVPT